MFNYKVVLAVLASASIGWSAAAHADTFTFTGNGTTGGGAVNTTATVTTGAGFIDILLTNNTVNPTDVAQNISDFEIVLNTTVGPATYNGTQTNTTATVASGGSFTTGTSNNTWALTNPASNEIMLNDLAAGACGPQCTILGQPGPAGYSNANGSIAGNGPHNPFFFETGNFDILAAGVTASTVVTGVTFSFGTTPGVDVPGVPSSTPLPGAFGLFGSVLFGGLGVSRWRKRRARGPVSVMA